MQCAMLTGILHVICFYAKIMKLTLPVQLRKKKHCNKVDKSFLIKAQHAAILQQGVNDMDQPKTNKNVLPYNSFICNRHSPPSYDHYYCYTCYCVVSTIIIFILSCLLEMVILTGIGRCFMVGGPNIFWLSQLHDQPKSHVRSLYTYYVILLCCAKHNQHAKARGVWGHTPQENFKE